MPFGRLVFFTFFLSASTTNVESSLGEEKSDHEQTLIANGIDVSATGLKNFLKQLQPTGEQRGRAQKLIEALGSDDSVLRDEAMEKLLRMRPLPTGQLTAALQAKDLEIAWRAKKILEHGETESDRILFAALKTIQTRKITGLLAELFQTVELCDHPRMQLALASAIQASATDQDANLLRNELRNVNVEVRIIAIKALFKALENMAIKDAVQLLKDANPGVQLAAARGLAELGERSSLEPLANLLGSDDISIRSQSSMTLKSLTGENFGFSAYAEDEKREKAIQQWKSWIGSKGLTAELVHPLPVYSVGSSNLNGHTLAAFGYKNKVVEYDKELNEIWSYNASGAYSAVKLNNGNYLIGCYAAKQVIEVTPEKKIVWQYPVESCINARPLANGNILIAGHTSKQVIEVTRDKTVVWKFKYDDNCYDAHRLANGNTLISSNKGVFEVNPKGDKVWELSNGHQHYGVQPLPNGNILLADFKEGAKEITREKKVVWQHAVKNAFDAQRLENGNTVITTSTGFFEITKDGTKLWSKSGNSYGRARR